MDKGFMNKGQMIKYFYMKTRTTGPSQYGE